MRFGFAGFSCLAFSLAVGQITPFTLLIFSSTSYFEWKGEHGLLPGFLGRSGDIQAHSC
jgi:hypothetical protein